MPSRNPDRHDGPKRARDESPTAEILAAPAVPPAPRDVSVSPVPPERGEAPVVTAAEGVIPDGMDPSTEVENDLLGVAAPINLLALLLDVTMQLREAGAPHPGPVEMLHIATLNMAGVPVPIGARVVRGILTIRQRGLTAEEVAAVTTKVKLRKSEDSCAVCLERLKARQNGLKINQCGHVFHAKCLEEWLRNNRTCPVCRCKPRPPAQAE